MPKFGIDQLREATVKILGPDGKTAGSGFIIRSDGHLITCHHVICQLGHLQVEYQGKIYEAKWCRNFSDPDVDLAILKIDLTDTRPIPIVNPPEPSGPVIVYGFPKAKDKYFPEGFGIHAPDIHPISPVRVLSTFSSTQMTLYGQPWNLFPKKEASFLAHRINQEVDSGCSGGPVFSEDYGGVVGVIQCTGAQESYAIRWDNIKGILDKLGLEPEKKAFCAFLKEVENRFQYMPLFHDKQQIVIENQYVPIQVTLERRYKHVVETTWGYAESDEELKQAYSLKGLSEEVELKQVSWEQAKKEQRTIMVLADPGMGKSTLLCLEARLTAQAAIAMLEQGQATVAEVNLPILLRLSELQKEEKEISEILPQLLRRDHPVTFPDIAYLLEEKLNSGQCLLLLDALDEVPLEHRQSLSEKLDRFIRRFGRCPIFCTSRHVGYAGGFLAGAKEMEIVPFRKEEIERFIRSWFANAAPVLKGKRVTPGGLIRELRDKPQIHGLSQNPLLLSLLCSLYQEDKLTLPARRAEIYEKALRLILGKWRQRRRPQAGTRITAKTIMLEELAYQFSCEGKEIFSSRDLLAQIAALKKRPNLREEFKDLNPSTLITELSEEDGIIQKLSREDSRFIFLHRTFQEYLTASYLKEIIETDKPRGIRLARKHFWDFDWHETLALLAGILADPLLLLHTIRAEKDDIFRSMLLLAGRCLSECHESSASIWLEIIDQTYHHWQANPELRWFDTIITSLGQAHKLMRRKLYEALKDQDVYVRSQAIIALGQIGSPDAMPAMIKALKDQDEYVRSQAITAVRQIGSPEAVPALIHALKDQDRDVRQRAAEALGQIGSPEAVPALIQALKDQDENVRSQAIATLGQIGSPESVAALIQALKDQDGDVRQRAAEALGQIGSPEALLTLTQDLKNQDEYVRRRAAEVLGQIGSPEAVPALIQALKDQDENIRSQAIAALGQIGSPASVPALIHAFKDQDRDVRQRAAEALGQIGSPEAVPALIHALKDQDKFVKLKIFMALRQIGSPELVTALINALKDQDKDVKRIAACTLGEIGSPEVVPLLTQALKDQDENVRRRAAEALGQIGSPEAVPALTQALKDQDNGVKFWAAEALGQIGSPEAVPALIRTLKDQDEYVRKWGAEALGQIGSPESVPDLIQTLKDRDWHVRFSAAEALGKIGNPESVPTLTQDLKDQDINVRIMAFDALVEIGSPEILKQLIQDPEADFNDPLIFFLARELALRYSKEKFDFIPVYPELIEQHRGKNPRAKS